MKLSDIRTTDDLNPAIYWYCDNGQHMCVTEAKMYRNIIQERAKQLGLTRRTLEAVARIYLAKGEESARLAFDDCPFA